ncbi:hypothetical protein DPMN_055882 [Dreissena polymorpha]|uniref:DNA2/NAM7 helicase-like C-terminal domain-containing protein n=1 Tax=Dreissena polymorpha TaxID=45954 RepID=A0A9D4CQQ9_DREPO|nr:hypothetical protein DPMN_055882 [Dreissena polymorpha]
MNMKHLQHNFFVLSQVGISGSEIGVIAPYRGQVLHLREKLGQGHHQGSSVEVNTVDQYQGRDKDIIIISFVMSSSCEKEKVCGKKMRLCDF